MSDVASSDPEAPFDEGPLRDRGREGDEGPVLVVDLDGFEGPLDVLLKLARTQKVDLLKISVLDLAEQYLAFVATARQENLELAADYLVTAAWLAYLKSRLLLPKEEQPAEEPDADEMAAYLAFRLKRLEAMRTAAEALMARPRLGLDLFGRGAPEPARIETRTTYTASLFELLKAYARQKAPKPQRAYTPDRPIVISLEEARAQLRLVVGDLTSWQAFDQIMESLDLGSWFEEPAPSQAEDRGASQGAPQEGGTGSVPLVPERLQQALRSRVASGFSASLQLTKEGRLELKQMRRFDPIYMRAVGDRQPANEPGDGGQVPKAAADLVQGDTPVTPIAPSVPPPSVPRKG